TYLHLHSLPPLLLTIPSFFFFIASPPTDIYTLSLHDALPICHLGDRRIGQLRPLWDDVDWLVAVLLGDLAADIVDELLRNPVHRSEEHTSELQSRGHLVCRLLLEKKKKRTKHDGGDNA